MTKSLSPFVLKLRLGTAEHTVYWRVCLCVFVTYFCHVSGFKNLTVLIKTDLELLKHQQMHIYMYSPR